DIGCDLGQHLVGREKELVVATEQHDLLGGMSTPGQDLEIASAEAQDVTGEQPPVGLGQAGNDAQVFVTLGDDVLGGGRVETVVAIEVAVMLGLQSPRIEVQVE